MDVYKSVVPGMCTDLKSGSSAAEFHKVDYALNYQETDLKCVSPQRAGFSGPKADRKTKTNAFEIISRADIGYDQWRSTIESSEVILHLTSEGAAKVSNPPAAVA